MTDINPQDIEMRKAIQSRPTTLIYTQILIVQKPLKSDMVAS